ncbi:MAG: hypothetical protein K8S87_03775 [Planctomycetes bacterium]|nr:hypothetical protein [Planctomycetota bacterium]
MSEQNPMDKNKAVANFLMKKELATKEQIQKAIAYQKKNSEKKLSLLRVLVGMKVLDKEAAQKIQASMKKSAVVAKKPEKPKPETPAALEKKKAAKSDDGLGFAEDEEDVLEREKRAGTLGVQMFDGEADISGLDIDDDGGQKITGKKADYFDPVEVAAKKQNQNKQPVSKKKKAKDYDPENLKCPNCGAKVKESWRRCKDCAMPLDLDELRSRPQDMHKKSWKMIAVPAVILLIVLIAIFVFMQGKDDDDKSNKPLTEAEIKQLKKDKLKVKKGELYTAVDEIKKLATLAEKEKEALRLQAEIKKFTDENSTFENAFDRQHQIISLIIKEAEKKRGDNTKKTNNGKDDDNGETVKTDDDDDDDEEIIPDRTKKKIKSFMDGLNKIFAVYKPGWETPTNEFSKGVSAMSKVTIKNTVVILIDLILEEKAPLTAIPEVTKESGKFIANYEPWGVCLNYVINQYKWMKTPVEKEIVFKVYQKYMIRYPYKIVSKLNTVGKEYSLQMKDYLYDETVIDNPSFMLSKTSSRNLLLSTLRGLDEEHYDKVAEIIKPMIDHKNYEWARNTFDWFLKNRPELAVDKAVSWLKSKDERKPGYSKLKIRKFGENDNAKDETKKLYADAIEKLIKDAVKPDIDLVKLILLLDKELGIATLTKLMKSQVIVKDTRYRDRLMATVYESFKREIRVYFPQLIKNTELNVFYRDWMLERLIKMIGDEHFGEIMDLIFSLLENEDDELNPLDKALKLLKKKAAEGTINMRDYWVKFKVYFDNHKRKDGFELFLAMDICDASKSIDEAYGYLLDVNANDDSRAKLLKWYFEGVNNDDKVLEILEKILKSSVKPGNETIVVVEQIKVNLLFKKCENKDFKLEGSRLNRAVISSIYSTIIAIEKNGRSLVVADQGGLALAYYDLRQGSKTIIDRKAVSEAWANYKKEKKEWDELEKKGDKIKPLPPPGNELDFKEQIVLVNIGTGNTVRVLTSAGNIEKWDLSPKNLTPAVKGAKKSPYCLQKFDIKTRVKELKDITLTMETIASSSNGNMLAVKIAGNEVLIINLSKTRFVGRVAPGSFTFMKFDSEGDKILFYGGESKKVRIYDAQKPKKALVLDIKMESKDYASFGMDSKTVIVSSKNFLWRFDTEKGEKNPVYLVPSLIIDSFYRTFIMGDGKYFGEINRGQIRVRELKDGKTIEAIGKIDDSSEAMLDVFVVSGNGKFVVFLMKDSSIMVFKID